MRISLLGALLLLVFASPAGAVDGAIEINDARAAAGGVTPGDTPLYPITIDRPGNYRLTGDLFVSGPNIDVIRIMADQVNLDLNGFSIRCLWVFTPCAGTGSGIGINAAGSSYVTVRNGTVFDMPVHGVVVGDASVVQDLRVHDNGGAGIVAGDNVQALGNTVIGNGGRGIDADRGRVVRNVVVGNSESGIVMFGSGMVLDNYTAGHSGTHAGLEMVLGVALGRNYFSDGILGLPFEVACNVIGSTESCPP